MRVFVVIDVRVAAGIAVGVPAPIGISSIVLVADHPAAQRTADSADRRARTGGAEETADDGPGTRAQSGARERALRGVVAARKAAGEQNCGNRQHTAEKR